MNIATFWQLVGLIDQKALAASNDRKAVLPLINKLQVLPINEIESFDDIMAQNLYDIDGEIYSRNAGKSGGSGDGFLYIRLYVIARGQKFYESVKENPHQMPNNVEQWREELLYVPRIAWGLITNNHPSLWPHKTPVSYESFSNKSLWNNSGV